MSPYIPTEKFSPSGLSKALDCKRAYALRYLTGEKEPQLTWPEAQALTKPVMPKKATKEQQKAHRAALKAYNKLYRPALGKEVHLRLQLHYHGCIVDWEDVPGRIALMMLQHTPGHEVVLNVETEHPISIAADIAGDIELRGTRDACFQYLDGRWLLVDYKTTYTFDFIDWKKTIKTVKTPEQLQRDPQANIYALDVMQKQNLQELYCRWVYGRTEDAPAACAVDFTITRASAEAAVRELVVLVRELRGYMREKVKPLEVEGNPASCLKFGGCIYHIDKGGPCVPPKVNAAQRLLQLNRKRRDTMAGSFRDRAKAAEAGVTESSSEATAPIQTEMPAEDNAPSGPDDVNPPSPAEVSSSREMRGTRAPKVKLAEGSQAETIAALAVELAAADKAREAVLARLRAAVA